MKINLQPFVNKFAYLPVVVKQEGKKNKWIWLKKYQERILKRHNFVFAECVVWERLYKSECNTVEEWR